MTNLLDDFRNRVCTALAGVDLEQLDSAIQAIRRADSNDKCVFIMGNGGSAASAAHLMCDMKYAEGKARRLRVMNLSDNVPLLTALANDVGYREVFRMQLEQILRPGDVVISISVSGDSENVVLANIFAREKGAVTIAFLGSGGGRAGKLVEHPIVVDNDDFPVVESVHCVLTQMVAASFRNGTSKHSTK
ncbi:MAG TPA: SIS domain-containing protein [Myxococcota bacterium]|nr:SIS domain-containing protein [Myxococcota bacterium]